MHGGFHPERGILRPRRESGKRGGGGGEDERAGVTGAIREEAAGLRECDDKMAPGDDLCRERPKQQKPAGEKEPDGPSRKDKSRRWRTPSRKHNGGWKRLDRKTGGRH